MSDNHVRELERSLREDLKSSTALGTGLEYGLNGFGDFLDQFSDKDNINKDMYDTSISVEVYRNFLNWLFSTFRVDELAFRKDCIGRLGNIEGKRVLITSCGLGEDVKVASDYVGANGFVHAQDLSRHFVSLAAEKCSGSNVVLTVSDALDLPYIDDYFDAVYHFGGINLFGDISLAISEMNRVCKVGGTVLFGDESVARHLRESDYGEMFIENNSLWKQDVPLQHLPVYAEDIRLSYVLGNCFYLLSFRKSDCFPDVDIDIEHRGLRGGSVRKRYFGKIDGVDVTLKKQLYARAKLENVSVNQLVEKLLGES